MPAAPSGSEAAGVPCGMQSNSGHCSALNVPPRSGLRSAGAKSGSLGPLIAGEQVAARAAAGKTRTRTRTRTSLRPQVTSRNVPDREADSAAPAVCGLRSAVRLSVRDELAQRLGRNRAREVEALRERATER